MLDLVLGSFNKGRCGVFHHSADIFPSSSLPKVLQILSMYEYEVTDSVWLNVAPDWRQLLGTLNNIVGIFHFGLLFMR